MAWLFKSIDIFGNNIEVDDEVLYARKTPYEANGTLVHCRVVKINDTYLSLIPVGHDANDKSKNQYRSTTPQSQLYIFKKTGK